MVEGTTFVIATKQKSLLFRVAVRLSQTVVCQHVT